MQSAAQAVLTQPAGPQTWLVSGDGTCNFKRDLDLDAGAAALFV